MEYRTYPVRPSHGNAVIGAGYIERQGQPDQFTRLETGEYRMSIVLEGTGILIDGETNAWPIMRHSVYQCFPGQPISLYVDISKPWREFCISVSAPAMEALRTLSSFHDGAPVFQIELYPHLSLWMNDIAESLAKAPPSLLIEEYFNLQRLILNVQMQQDDPADAFALSLIRQATAMVLRDTERLVSISDMAETFFISQARLTRIFRKYTQTTPLKYLSHLRFCYADRLLHEGKSIREVAAMFGYADQFSFSKQFKQSMGISPSVSQRRAAIPEDTAPAL